MEVFDEHASKFGLVTSSPYCVLKLKHPKLRRSAAHARILRPGVAEFYSAQHGRRLHL